MTSIRGYQAPLPYAFKKQAPVHQQPTRVKPAVKQEPVNLLELLSHLFKATKKHAPIEAPLPGVPNDNSTPADNGSWQDDINPTPIKAPHKTIRKRGEVKFIIPTAIDQTDEGHSVKKHKKAPIAAVHNLPDDAPVNDGRTHFHNDIPDPGMDTSYQEFGAPDEIIRQKGEVKFIIPTAIDQTDEGHSIKKHKKAPVASVHNLPEETPGYDIEPRQVHAPLGLDPAENRQKMRDAYGDDYYGN